MSRLVRIAAVVILVVAACDESDKASFRVERTQDVALGTKAAAYLPRLLQACPGLNKYAEDFSPAIVATTTMIDYPNGIEFLFKVDEHPRTIPESIRGRSAGHNCYVTVSEDGHKAYIAKRACHSLCNGVWQENDPNSLGREFRLQ